MTPFEKWAVLVGSVLATLTGLGLFGVKYLMRPSDPWAVVNHPLQPWLLKLHVLVVPLLVFALGAIAVRHVWRHVRAATPFARRSGLTAALAAAPMIATGYLIQVLTAETLLQAVAWSHIGLGVLYAVGVGVHFRVTRRSPSRRSAPVAGAPWPALRRVQGHKRPVRDPADEGGSPGAGAWDRRRG